MHVREREQPTLESGTNGNQLVHNVFDRDDAVLAKVLFNNGIVRQRQTLTIDLAVSTFQDELANRLEIWLSVQTFESWLSFGEVDAPIRHIGLHKLQHLRCCLGHLDKDAIVDLTKTQELENLARLGCNLVDTVGR